MNNYNVSFWESQSFLKQSEVIIIGSGIVGLSTAISLKEQDPKLDVLIIDRNSYPLGASTRNAGFACFGSVTELLDDLENNEDDKVFSLLNERVNGLNILKERVGDVIDYSTCGSYELFDRKNANIDSYLDKIDYLNRNIFERTGLADVFEVKNTLKFPFSGFSPIHIMNKFEGQLHPGKMTQKLIDICQSKGVRFLFGTQVEQIVNEKSSALIECEGFEIKCKKAILCSNGFTNAFFTDLDLKPARNQVIVTEEIPNLDWSACFHYDRGYIYFRNIGKRILLGGARNVSFEEETKSSFGLTSEILTHLKEFLYQKIGVQKKIKIEHSWSGIMGVGSVKSPIIKNKEDNIILAVRLGGMGVALGSLVGKKTANLVLSQL